MAGGSAGLSRSCCSRRCRRRRHCGWWRWRTAAGSCRRRPGPPGSVAQFPGTVVMPGRPRTRGRARTSSGFVAGSDCVVVPLPIGPSPSSSELWGLPDRNATYWSGPGPQGVARASCRRRTIRCRHDRCPWPGRCQESAVVHLAGFPHLVSLASGGRLVPVSRRRSPA